MKLAIKKLIFSFFTIGFFLNILFSNSKIIFANQDKTYKLGDIEKLQNQYMFKINNKLTSWILLCSDNNLINKIS